MAADTGHVSLTLPTAATGAARRRARRTAFLMLSPGLIWLAVFVLVPFGFAIAMSFWTSTIFGTTPAFQFGNYAQALATPFYRNLLVKTLWVSFVTTLISLAISYPIAYLLATLRGTAKTGFVLLLFLPFWTSYVVRTFVWLPILGTTGAINQFLLYLGLIDHPIGWLLYDSGAVYIGLIYVYTLFMTLPIYLSIDKIDPRLIEAAADLGARPFWIFWRVILPLSWPGVLSGSLMVFLLSVSAYVTPQLLGGTSGILYSNMIAIQYISTNNWAFGAALSVVLFGVVLLLLIVFGRWIGLQQVVSGGRR
ncbi:MAG TPA: ABC transporter permease [Alphaproteobacteria bacterium]|nr:ABC transporter permease [Alphaproteobacteria bacterium]